MERAAAAKNSDREIPKNIEDFEVEANYIEIFFEDGRPIDIDLQAVYESILEEELIKEVYELRNC
jgi:argininosuccinate synthase